MTNRLTDEQLRFWRLQYPQLREVFDELFAHRAPGAREAQLEAALRQIKGLSYPDRAHRKELQDRLMQIIDICNAALSGIAQPAESGATARNLFLKEWADGVDRQEDVPREQSASNDEEAARELFQEKLATIADDDRCIALIAADRAQARAEGKAEGMEAAARIFEDLSEDNVCRTDIAAAIRAEAKP